MAQVEVFFQTSLESGLASRIWSVFLPGLGRSAWFSCLYERIREQVTGAWGGQGSSLWQLPRGLPPNCSKPYRLGGISNTISGHCFPLVIKRRPVPCCGSSQLLWWERGGRCWWTSPLGPYLPGCAQPLGHSAASQGRAAALSSHTVRRCRGAWPRPGSTAMQLFPKGPRRYLRPHLQGKVWPSGRRAGSVVG